MDTSTIICIDAGPQEIPEIQREGERVNQLDSTEAQLQVGEEEQLQQHGGCLCRGAAR